MSERKFMKTFLMIFILLAFGVFTAQAQMKTRLSPLGNLIAGIQERADNLTYISEQDWDVNVFVIGRNLSILNSETFQAANPFVAYQPIEEISIDEYFSRLQKQHEAWTTLRNYLEVNLTQLKVFKIGTVRREIYAIDLFQGHIVGIRTFAVET